MDTMGIVVEDLADPCPNLPPDAFGCESGPDRVLDDLR
jgi:hypothetical protein